MGLQTEIRNGEDYELSLYEPDYDYNVVCIRDDYSLKSQIFTNNFTEIETWMKDVKGNSDKVIILSRRKIYKNGEFVGLELLDWVNLLENLYDYMDEDSRRHIDAAFQM